MSTEHPPALVPESALPDRISAVRALGPIWPSQVVAAPATMQLPNADYRSMVRLGLLILVLGFGGITAWALLAPLDEGIPAIGSVAVESSRSSSLKTLRSRPRSLKPA